ncbi:hypothetical protein AAFF_G00260430 [Aldrovandia affinis]|uniref:Uncharacterized protein n=1 Tax=Aldrovandia affinis TaxID=143900 RepID=A0AAD7RC57_9TELE|nr:hypothetical protein AAFF_G00260430 [Aldrovandia affinis]
MTQAGALGACGCLNKAHPGLWLLAEKVEGVQEQTPFSPFRVQSAWQSEVCEECRCVTFLSSGDPVVNPARPTPQTLPSHSGQHNRWLPAPCASHPKLDPVCQR